GSERGEERVAIRRRGRGLESLSIILEAGLVAPQRGELEHDAHERGIDGTPVGEERGCQLLGMRERLLVPPFVREPSEELGTKERDGLRLAGYSIETEPLRGRSEDAANVGRELVLERLVHERLLDQSKLS